MKGSCMSMSTDDINQLQKKKQQKQNERERERVSCKLSPWDILRQTPIVARHCQSVWPSFASFFLGKEKRGRYRTESTWSWLYVVSTHQASNHSIQSHGAANTATRFILSFAAPFLSLFSLSSSLWKVIAMEGNLDQFWCIHLYASRTWNALV